MLRASQTVVVRYYRGIFDMTRLSDKLETAMKAGTQGEWSVDTVRSEGEYGSGPDTHSGFHVSAIFGPNGETLFDALNSDAARVTEEYDDEGYCYAWDEVSGHNAQFIALCHNYAASIIAALRKRGE